MLANGETRARWQISLARRRPRPATMCWSRRKPWSRIGWATSSVQRESTSSVSASGPRPSSGACSSGSPATTHTPALRSVPASVSSRARPSANRHRACPKRGLADCFSSTLRRPPCIRCTTKVATPKSSSRCLPRRPTKTSSWPWVESACGTAVFSTVKASGTKRSSWAVAKARSRRSAWAWISGSSGIRHHTVAVRASPKMSSRACSSRARSITWRTSPPTRKRPDMKAT